MKQGNIWRLKVLVCCIGVNYCSKISYMFRKIINQGTSSLDNETKVTTKNNCHQDQVGIKDSHKLYKTKVSLFNIFADS